jgi:hypothetical protein
VSTRWLIIVLVLGFFGAALAIGSARYFGFGYEPAESLAGPMTPEWRDFAEDVDRTCARDFNRGQADLADLDQRYEEEGWSPEGEADYWQAQAKSQHATHDDIAALGDPPARKPLFENWLANVSERADLMDQAAREWLEDDRGQAGMVRLRILARKIDANWLGQHFGLRICTSNGPGRDPGSSDDPYLTQVNDVCLWRNAEEDKSASKRALTPNAIYSLSVLETLKMAAIGPPTDQYPLRARILETKRSLDDFVQSQLQAAEDSPAPGRTWERLVPSVNDRASQTQLKLEALGLRDCGNWGPTPAPSSLPMAN